jgi:hypothetical protein
MKTCSIESGHKNSFEQCSVCTITYQDLSPIGHLLHIWFSGRTKSATIAGSGTSQKFILICQLFMDSHYCKCIESTKRHFCNIPPIVPTSLHCVLTSPDAESARKSPNGAQFPTLLFFPTMNTFHYSQNFCECHSQPVLHAEFACQLRLTVAPLGVA